MNNAARETILASIRSHLAASPPDEPPVHLENPVILSNPPSGRSPVDGFKHHLELVNGHCFIAEDDAGIARALTEIVTTHHARRLAISENPEVERLLQLTDLEIDELGITPNAADIFRFDVGITTAQAAIAETGTLVLDSACERHRLVSLVPPVHIAILAASRIYETFGEVLTLLQQDKEISPAVTFITGPSRTADIELTLAIGVHGPQEVYVIINGST